MAKRAAKKERVVPAALAALAALPPPGAVYPPDPPRGSITEGLDILPAFSALIREGKAAQYHWLAEAMGRKGVLPSPSSWEGMRVASLLEGFEEERRSFTSTTQLPPTYLRTVRVWIGMKERPCTEEELNDLKDGVERQGLEWDPDLPRTTSDIHIATGPEDEQYPDAFPTTADIARSQFPELGITELGTEEHYGRWAEEFTAEVEVAAGRFAGDPELPHAFTGLVKELREFRPATYQAKGLRAELEGMAEGAAFLDAMDRERERLVRRLERIAGGHMATTGTTATQGTTEQPVTPIQWKGTVQQLAWVLRELAEKGWIGAQTHKGNTKKWMAGDINASAFAKAMAPHFGNINLGTLERELKAEGGTVPAQDVVGWDIPQRPE